MWRVDRPYFYDIRKSKVPLLNKLAMEAPLDFLLHLGFRLNGSENAKSLVFAEKVFGGEISGGG